MSELPSHSDTGPAPAPDGVDPGSGRRRWLLIAGGVALAVLFVVLHLTGVVGAGGHG